MSTLDSMLNIAKSVSATVGSTLTALVATGVIPLPGSWQGAATAAGVALTGFAVWLTNNGTTIERDLGGAFGSVGQSTGLDLTALEQWAATVPDNLRDVPVDEPVDVPVVAPAV